jgi:hypothetical protein
MILIKAMKLVKRKHCAALSYLRRHMNRCPFSCSRLSTAVTLQYNNYP